MYLLLNRDEAVTGLAKLILAKHLKKIKPTWQHTTEYIDKIKLRYHKSKLLEIDFNKVNELLKKDLQSHRDTVTKEYKNKYRPLINWLVEKFDSLDIDHRYLLQTYLDSSAQNFVKTVGQQLTDSPVWTISGSTVPDDQTVVFRNVLNNESLLHHRMSNQLPFWFVDSGYTNFLTDNKPWHRLVTNHLHHDATKKYFPADRLHLLPSLPAPWRHNGDEILVIENSEHHHQCFGTTLEQWIDRLNARLQKLTDRKVVYRAKNLDRKNRDNLYEHLKNSNYYCVITDASCAAIEAVWAGIPIITLNQHISIPVARTSIEDINDLYRGPIGDWLCAVSYSQFTKKEMFNGTALEIIKKYHV